MPPQTHFCLYPQPLLRPQATFLVNEHFGGWVSLGSPVGTPQVGSRSPVDRTPGAQVFTAALSPETQSRAALRPRAWLLQVWREDSAPRLQIQQAVATGLVHQPRSFRGPPWLPGRALWDLGSKQSRSRLQHSTCALRQLQEAVLLWLRIEDTVLGPLRLGLLEAFGILLGHPIWR